MIGIVPFPKPLQLGQIQRRPNRFVAETLLNGLQVRAHCPVSGRIGGFDISGLPCLVSGPYDGGTCTHRVEAIGLEPMTSPTFQWIGINQTRCNRVVEAMLKDGTLKRAFPEASPSTVRRERKLATSRIDFLIERTFVEVKTPLLEIHAQSSPTIIRKQFAPGNPSERLPRQLEAMGDAIEHGHRGAMLVVFQYLNTLNTTLKEQLTSNIFADQALQRARSRGLEQWVCEMRVNPAAIEFVRLSKV